MRVEDEIRRLLKKAEDLEKKAGDDDQTLHEAAAKAYEEATELSEKHYGNLHEFTLNLRPCWADSLRNAGKLTQAITCHYKNVEWMLENLKQCKIKESRNTTMISEAQERHLDAQRRLAETYLANEQHADAISVYEAVVETKATRSLEDYCKARVDLAAALFESGSDRNIMRAFNLNTETLQIADENLGKSHIETSKVRYNLGSELYDLKKYDDASLRFGELLEILQAKDSRARSAPEYREYLKDTKAMLKNCSTKIARREDKIKSQMGEAEQAQFKEGLARQIEAEEKRQKAARNRQEADENRKRARLDRVEADEKRKDADERRSRKEQRKGQVAQGLQIKETATLREDKTTKQAMGGGSELELEESERAQSRAKTVLRETNKERGERKDEKLDGERRSQGSRASTRDDGVAKETDIAKKPGRNNTGQTEQGKKRETPGQEQKDVTKPSYKVPNEPSTRHRSAPALADCSGVTEAHMVQLQRSESARNDAAAYPNMNPSGTSRVSKDRNSGRVAEAERAEVTTVPAQEEAKSEEAEKKRKDRHANGPSKRRTQLGPVMDQVNSKSGIDTTDGAIKPSNVRTGKHRENYSEKLGVVSSAKAGLEDRPRSALERTRPSEDERASRRLSAPTIMGPEQDESGQGQGIQKKTRGLSAVGLETQGHFGKERSKSSQSYYRIPSSSSTTTQSRKTEPRSGSSEPKQRKASPGLKREFTSSAAQMPKIAEKDRTRPTKPGDKEIADAVKFLPDRLEGSGEVARPDVTGTLFQDSFRGPTDSWADANDTVLIHSGTRDTLPQTNMANHRMTGDTTSGADRFAETQSQAASPPKPVIITRTSLSTTKNAERLVPGGWHQDFDEPAAVGKLRRVRSSEQNSEGGLRVSKTNESNHRRASSVVLPRTNVSATKSPLLRTWDPQEENRADEWFTRLRDRAHVLLDKYKDDSQKTTKSERRVKIAVLDSGVAKSPTNGPVPLLMKGPRIKFGKQLDPSLPWNMDTKGHGTHAVGLILAVCPYADVYVYRVCKDNASIDRRFVANAITDAVDKKKVDIISMSFGWEGNSDFALENAIQHARANHVLLFAATSNEGIRTNAGMAYPARAFEVIAVDAADVHGNPSKFNPPQTGDKTRFTALGEAVRSTYPMHLPSEDPESGWKRLDGTSCATPIAAGIAGLVLEFARQRPMCFDERIEKRLKTVEGMQLILTHLVSRKSAENSRFNHLDPTFLFGYNEEYQDGGDWAEPLSPRFTAAVNIVNKLREVFSQDIGSLMSVEFYKEWARRGLQ